MGLQLGYTGKAAMGSDDITLGWQGAGGPTMKNRKKNWPLRLIIAP